MATGTFYIIHFRTRRNIFHCFPSMFAAILHQINRGGVSQSVQQLRNLAAEFMRSNVDDFMPFMDEVENEEQYMKYCDDLQRTAAWGSQLEVHTIQSSSFLTAVVALSENMNNYCLACRGREGKFRLMMEPPL